MSTVQQVAARLTSTAAESLARSVRAMPADKIDWRPLDQGRSVLSQVQECATVATFFARILRDRAVPPSDDSAFGNAMAELDTIEKALAALAENTRDLEGAILSFQDEHLADRITMPWGSEPVPFSDLLFMNYWNLVYHSGQTAYIQTLYGDREMH